MAMYVQHNITSMNASRNLGITSSSLEKSTEKLSSGYRVNRAADDAAGLAISEKMRGQIRGLTRASTNSEDGISLIQTAEGALGETHSILQRMRELAVQAASDTNTDDDREQIQNEIDQLTSEVDRIATSTEFNTRKLLNGSSKGAVSAKGGSLNVEGTFANGIIEAKASSDAVSVAGFTDVIRIEIKKDFSAFSKGTTLGDVWQDTSVMDLESLLGNAILAGGAFQYISITGNEIHLAAYSAYGVGSVANSAAAPSLLPSLSAGTGWGTASSPGSGASSGSGISAGSGVSAGSRHSNGSGYSAGSGTSDAAPANMTITISHIDKLKAGDVITITVGKMIETEPAKSGAEAIRLQIGANAGQETNLGINSMKAKDLDIVDKDGEPFDVTVQKKASLAIAAYDLAIRKVSTERAKMGALQNRLEHTIANLDTAAENLQAAESRIRDTDMADEMTRYSKNSILMQAGQSMLAQANQATQGVLSLLQQ